MRIVRTLPPAAVPISVTEFFSGIKGAFQKDAAVERFKGQLKDYFKVRHCYLLSSGKAALAVVFQALKKMYPEKDEVLIPAFTCYSVPSAIIRAGLKVRLCDIDAQTLDFDFSQLPSKLSAQRLLCILPTHLFGLPAAVERVRQFIGDQPIPIVEDAAQALGGEHNGHKLGTIGDVGFFSLGRGKALSTIEGGVIITNDDQIAAELNKIVSQTEAYSLQETILLALYAVALMIFLHPLLFWVPKSMPFLKLGETVFNPNYKIRKMGGFQAGLSCGWQKKLQKLQSERSASVKDWIENLPASVTMPRSLLNDDQSPPVIRFPVGIPAEDKALALLGQGQRLGLGISLTYPGAIHEIPQLAQAFKGLNFPVASATARRTLTLPVHGFVTCRDKQKILKLLRPGR